MPASTRVLVLDSDATSQGEIQELLVSRRFVALGGTDLGDESVAMALAFQPEVVLLNLDDGHESYVVADRVAGELPETRLIGYSRGRDLKSMGSGAGIGLAGRAVKVVPVKARDLLEAIESALAGPQEPAPLPVDIQPPEPVPPPPVAPAVAPPVEQGWPYTRAAPLRENAQALMRLFAELASEWLLTRSPQTEERLMATLAEDVQVPSFGGLGRDAVRQGLEAIAWRLGSDFRLVPSELGAEPVLVAMVPSRDGRWRRAGYLLVGIADGRTVGYFDYRDDEPPGEGGGQAPSG